MPGLRRRKHLRFDSLLRFLNRSGLEIRRCEDAHAYLAGCALVGAAVEYALTAMLRAYPDIVYRRGKKLKAHWDLKGLIDFARACGWLDYKAFRAAERIRKNRNMLHPNWFASRRPPLITKKMLDARNEDFEEVSRSLNKWFFG